MNKKGYGGVGTRKRGRKKWVLGFVLLAGLCLLLGGSCRGGNRVTKPVAIEHVGRIPVYESFLPEDAIARPGLKRQVLYVVIHETDNPSRSADAEAHASFLQQNCRAEKKSWHYTVDDQQIYHHLPDDEAAFHASDGLAKNGGNLNGIGVELCVNKGGNYEKTIENAVQLTAHLLSAYGLGVEAVKTHQDFCGKHCPAQLLSNNRWDEFRDRVAAALSET